MGLAAAAVPVASERETVVCGTSPLMTLGAAAAAHVGLIVWCRDCGHQVEPDPVEQVPVLEWREELVCSRRGSRQVDMVASGTERRESGATRSSSSASIGEQPTVQSASATTRNSLGMSWPSVGLNTADISLLQLFTRRTGALLRWQKKRGILRSVKDPQHGRFDLWEIAV